MTQAMVNFRMDKELKENMEHVCKEMGLSMTAAFTIFATKVSKEKRIPFEIAVDPFYSQENMDRLRKSIEQMETTGGTVHEVIKDD
jgi:DNA-damage-inducible protein J